MLMNCLIREKKFFWELEIVQHVICSQMLDRTQWVGPNLNEIRPDIQRIIMAVRNGIGVMPAMEGILTDEEIEAVAHYTSIAAEQ